jgi:hypothetical protein
MALERGTNPVLAWRNVYMRVRATIVGRAIGGCHEAAAKAISLPISESIRFFFCIAVHGSVVIGAHLEARHDGRVAGLEQVDAHEDVSVRGQRAVVRVVEVALARPVLDHVHLRARSNRLRIVTLGFGTGRLEMLLERWTNRPRSALYMRVRATIVSRGIGGRRETAS